MARVFDPLKVLVQPRINGRFGMMKPALSLRSRVTSLIMISALAVFAATPMAAADEKAPDLPLSASFGKGEPGENGGPYALTLTNTSDKALTVNATIIWSVASHNRARTIELPAHEVAAGGTWVIDDLAAEDRIILTAEGYAKLELKTPPGK